MNGRVLVKDTADVYYHLSNGDTRYFGCMDTSGIEKTWDIEKIKCGIGFGVASLMYSNPDMTISFTPALWNDYFIEDAMGTTFSEDEAVNVWTTEEVLFTVSTTDATATITGTPVGGVVKVQDKQGKFYPATWATGTVTATGGALLDGQKLPVSYQEAVTGNVLDMSIEEIPKVHGITLKTIAYDPDTNEIIADLVWKFDNVVGDGSLSLALQGATKSLTEISATVLPEAGSFGKYIVVPRA